MILLLLIFTLPANSFFSLNNLLDLCLKQVKNSIKQTFLYIVKTGVILQHLASKMVLSHGRLYNFYKMIKTNLNQYFNDFYTVKDNDIAAVMPLFHSSLNYDVLSKPLKV